MFCRTSQNVPAVQSVDFFAFVYIELAVFGFVFFPFNNNAVTVMPRWWRFSKERVSLFFIAVSLWKKFIFVWAFHCKAKFSKAKTKDDIKSQGLREQRKIEVSIKLDKIITEIGICFPIHVVVSVSLKFPSSTQIDSKSRMAMLLKSFCLFV